MTYAVVKFINDEDTSDEVVSEIPASWLTKDNTFCKWPPEKYVAIYINKAVKPQDEWKEYPVELECFCSTRAEAKQKASGNISFPVGRGLRKSKPVDYFSPAEEEERLKERKKEYASKKFTSTCTAELAGDNYHFEFVNLLGNNKNQENDKESGCSSDVESSVSQDLLPTTTIATDTTSESQVTKEFIMSPSPTDEGLVFTSATVIPENDITNLNKKLDAIICMLSTLKLELLDVKERIDGTQMKQIVEEEFPIQLPIRSLEELDKLDALATSVEGKSIFVKNLKKIGGNDGKDHTTRILKYLISNGLAELCSWTGRKNNFAIGAMGFMKLIFGVVHSNTKCTHKEFENAVMEWLRHAKQRKMREEKNK